MEEQFDCVVDNGRVIEKDMSKGWICPKCGVVVAPHLSTCPVCGGQTDESLAPGESIICG